MSAFVVSKSHIDAIVSVAIHGPKDTDSQWHGFSWARSCESYQPYPDICPDVWSEVRWMKVAPAGLSELATREGEITADELGFILWAENVASVRYRYPDVDTDEMPGTYDDDQPEVTHGYTYTDRPRQPRPTAVQALKLISCLDYQSCEHDGWKDSEAFAILASLKDNLIGCLPGYSDAPWEWSAPKVA
jgi:hypothetical protein